MAALYLAILALAPHGISGFQVLQVPTAAHTSRTQLLRSRRRPSRVALAMSGTDRAVGLLHGCAVYFDTADGYQVDVDGKRRPFPQKCWQHIGRFGDVNIEAGLPQISASAHVRYPARAAAVGLFRGSPAHIDQTGGFIVNVGGEWRPIRKEDWKEVMVLTDIDIPKMRREIVGDGGVNSTFYDDSTFTRHGNCMYQVVRRGTGACPTSGDTVKYKIKRWGHGFPGERNSEFREEDDRTLEDCQRSPKGFEHAMLWSMRVGEVRPVISNECVRSEWYFEIELLDIE
ncbi:unnamed protein product [Vitrella brassicaformis CCMP3155]|uniref:Uncharacterized protein n=1 Tax=Vitrella brassicaformis (strain CCMP3155) TaxID=1169540 RepID=A0A0G4EG54_VITBC|nr:unnamed protein product [Vitrella brassicaformis CCMP3155]|eukprot:CEL94692.1 unnamed protein product [Vitrella brassicaformis CCMP3155]